MSVFLTSLVKSGDPMALSPPFIPSDKKLSLGFKIPKDVNLWDSGT